jgi:D-alanine transaminase
MSNIAYVNGEFVELESATVSIEDRGFQFGDSIYEVVKLYNGKLFRLEEHLNRLLNSAQQIKLGLDYTSEELKEIIDKLLARSKGKRKQQGSLYIQITRGAAPRSHSFSPELTPTVIMYLLPPRKDLPTEVRDKGVKAVTMLDRRWGYCNIKTTNLLPNILASQEAKGQGAKEGIFITEEDKVTEGTSSNVFIVGDGVIKTHPLNCDILGGITRQVVLELAQDKFTVQEEEFKLSELYQAEEVFITSTTKEILGVVEVDDHTISTGSVGEVTKELYKDYKTLVEEFKD